MALNSLSGIVHSNAEARCTPQGQWLLQVDFELAATPKRQPVLARAVRVYGHSATDAQVCRYAASQLKRGRHVTVSYGTACLRAQRLELGEVQHIATDTPTYFKLPR